MIESDALGRGRAFIFVTLIGDEKIEISGVLVPEIGREGESPGAPCIGLPQWLPAVFALLLFPVWGFHGKGTPSLSMSGVLHSGQAKVLSLRRAACPFQ